MTQAYSVPEKALFTRATSFAVKACEDALAQARYLEEPACDPRRVSVCLGVGVPSVDFHWYAEIFTKKQYSSPAIWEHQKNIPSVLTSLVGKMAGAKGSRMTIHTACASSGQALGEAFQMISRGDADVVITGGADSMLNPLHMAGFCLLGALATGYKDPKTASRPFDVDRSGFVMGEGACILVFEEYESAKRRGANILTEVVGYGVTESAYRITDLHPEGVGPTEAMEMAIKDAGIHPNQIGYLNAHGTSTRLNDMVESLSISKVFGHENSSLRVSSTKSITGHLISAAGALELAICILALKEQVLPPTSNLEKQDADCPITLTDSKPQKADFSYALSNSIGFGGSNTAVIVGRV